MHPARPRLVGSHWLPEQEDLRSALPTTGPRLLAGDQAGAGWVPTYPANSARVPPLIDIDHVFLNDGLQATGVRSVAVPGTDHLGLLVTVDVTSGG